MSKPFQSDQETIETPAVSENSPPRVGVVGISFKSTPISVRERISRNLRFENLVKFKGLTEKDSEFVLLSTCNRVEVYFASKSPRATAMRISKLLKEASGEDRLCDYHYLDEKAVEHLFGVASGLDSLVVGEGQILSQVRDACKISVERNLRGIILAKLFAKASSCGREVRESFPNYANGFKNSVSSAVVDIISKYYADSEKTRKPNILLIGSGKMIKLAVGAIKKPRVGRILVAARKQQLKEIEADSVVHISQLARTIDEEQIDVIISATSSDSYILTSKDLPESSKARTSKNQLLIFDISVPRNVDPSIAKECRGIALMNLDDLKDRVQPPEILENGLGEDLLAIKHLIKLRCEEFTNWMNENSGLNPTLNAIRKKLERIRSEELENAVKRLPDLTPEQFEVVNRMSERLVRRLLHDPTIRLRELARTGESERARNLAEVLDDLFYVEDTQLNQNSEDDIGEKSLEQV